MGQRSDTTLDSAVSIRTAIELPPVQRGVPEVLSGEEQLGRPIRWAHACEIPDIASTLQGGELLLTTGLGIDRDDRGQRRFIDDLADRSVAGLIVELGRRFAQLPEPLVETARLRELPLIVLHRDVRFIEIIELIHRRILDSESVSLRRRDELHGLLSDLMRSGRGIEEVLGLLADAVDNPVVLEKKLEGIIFHAPHRSTTASVVAGLEAVRRGLSGRPPSVERPVPCGADEDWGTLISLGLETPTEDFDALALERGASVISMMLLQTREESRVARRERWNLLAGLLKPDLDETEAEMRALDFGFAATTMVPLVAGSDAADQVDEDAWSRIWHELERELQARHVAFIGGMHGVTGRAVIGLKSPAHRSQSAGVVAELIHDATARHTDGRSKAVVAVGRAGHSWSEMRDGLAEALEALDAAPALPARPWHDAAQPDFGRLIWTLKDQAEVRAFVEARLRPVVEYDRLRKSRLLETLEVFCRTGANKSATARALHLERQSLYHRLQRIEQVMGVRLDDDDLLLGIRFALKARRSFEPSTER